MPHFELCKIKWILFCSFSSFKKIKLIASINILCFGGLNLSISSWIYKKIQLA